VIIIKVLLLLDKIGDLKNNILKVNLKYHLILIKTH